MWDAKECSIKLSGQENLKLKVYFYHNYTDFRAEKNNFENSVKHMNMLFENSRWPLRALIKDIEYVKVDRDTYPLGNDITGNPHDMNVLKNIAESNKESYHVIISDKVMGSYCKGKVWDFPQNYLVMGKKYRRSLLCHEMGHCFGLDHPNEIPSGGVRVSMPGDNIMEENPQFRSTFVLGQLIQVSRMRESLLCKKTSDKCDLDRSGYYDIDTWDVPRVDIHLSETADASISTFSTSKELNDVFKFIHSDCGVNQDARTVEVSEKYSRLDSADKRKLRKNALEAPSTMNMPDDNKQCLDIIEHTLTELESTVQ